MNPLHGDEIGYAVVLRRAEDGVEFFATWDGCPKVFFRRKSAIAFRDELAAHGCGRGRVVKVRCRLEIVS